MWNKSRHFNLCFYILFHGKTFFHIAQYLYFICWYNCDTKCVSYLLILFALHAIGRKLLHTIFDVYYKWTKIYTVLLRLNTVFIILFIIRMIEHRLKVNLHVSNMKKYPDWPTQSKKMWSTIANMQFFRMAWFYIVYVLPLIIMSMS